MKVLYLTLSAVFLSFGLYAQEAIYYKAVYLRQFYNTTTKQIPLDANAEAVLKSLYSETDLQSLAAALNSNPFISPQVLFVERNAGSSTGFGFGSAVGGIDVSNITKGLSLFLIDRAKQELTITFFNRFRKFSEENPEFKILFPGTYSALDKLLDYSYPQMLPTLQKAFIKDLETVTTRTDELLEEPRYKALLEKLPEVSICIRSIKLIQELETGYANPAEVLKSFAGFPEWKTANATVALKNTGSILALINLFSESLRQDNSTGSKQTWIAFTDLKKLMEDDVLFRIYAALLYRKIEIEQINFYDQANTATAFATKFAQQAADINALRDKIKDFYMLTNEVSRAAKIIADKQAANIPVSDEEYYTYINTALDILNNASQTINKYTPVPSMGEYLVIVCKSNDIYKDVYTKDYARLFNDAIDVFDLMLKQVDARADYAALKNKASITGYKGKEKKEVMKMATMDGFFSEVATDKLDGVIKSGVNDTNLQLAVSHYRLGQLVNFFKELKPYGLFMANMVDAKNPEEVKAALDNAVLPVGSSSVKKNSNGNIAIQAYLGAYLSNKDNSYSSWASKFGVIAPVGISYTPDWLSWKQGGSLSLFGSLLDIGAIVDYDLKQGPAVPADGTTSSTAIVKDYKVKLGQIFSPGLFLVYGLFSNVPLSIGAGGQYGPGLSKVETSTATPVLNNPSWRWSLFLAVDIPLFNLRNKVKGK